MQISRNSPMVQAARPAWGHVACRTKKLMRVTDSLTWTPPFCQVNITKLDHCSLTSGLLMEFIDFADEAQST
jgi:hypothetical protein